jgi:hypothetical protein
MAHAVLGKRDTQNSGGGFYADFSATTTITRAAVTAAGVVTAVTVGYLEKKNASSPGE